MIVTSDFFDHWKTKALIELSGRPESPIWLMRLWAHCYNSKTTRFRLPDIALKAICNVPAEVPAEQWLKWLVDCRFLDGKSGDWTVHGFAEANAKLASAWVNGRKAHRSPTRHRTPTQDQPNGNPTKTESQLAPPKELEGRKEGRIEREGGKEEPEAAPPARSPDRPQGLWEVHAYVKAEALDVPEIEAAKFFDHFETNGWRTRTGPVKNWRAALRNWVRRSGEFAGTRPAKNALGGAAPHEAGKYQMPEIFT